MGLRTFNPSTPITYTELVFIGDFASISFLQFVREIVSARIGPSQFSHNDKNENMLETQSATLDQLIFEGDALDLSPEDQSSCFETYCLAVSRTIQSRESIGT